MIKHTDSVFLGLYQAYRLEYVEFLFSMYSFPIQYDMMLRFNVLASLENMSCFCLIILCVT